MRVSACAVAMLCFMASEASAASLKVIPRPKPVQQEQQTPPQATPPTSPAPSSSKEAPAPASPDNADGETQSAQGCLADLRSTGIAFSIPDSVQTTSECHIDNPVVIESVSSPDGDIALPGKPLFRCAFARRFTQWIAGVAGPVVSSHSGKRLAAISTGPGFVCRKRNGDTTAKISEHALGNAVDIDALILADKRRIAISTVADPEGRDTRMLMALRLSACGFFTTVLGPGSNEAHKEHYHFDFGVHGKSGNYRICE